MKPVKWTFCFALWLTFSLRLDADERAVNTVAPQVPDKSAAPPSSGVQEVDKPLNVSGQNRNLSMMMVLKGDRDEIHFVDVRKNYQDEVPQTLY